MCTTDQSESENEDDEYGTEDVEDTEDSGNADSIRKKVDGNVDKN